MGIDNTGWGTLTVDRTLYTSCDCCGVKFFQQRRNQKYCSSACARKAGKRAYRQSEAGRRARRAAEHRRRKRRVAERAAEVRG